MIPFDFKYYRPSSIQEAVELVDELKVKKIDFLFFCGGTEIITLGRMNLLPTKKAMIDIKEIPECNQYGFYDNQLIIGSAVSIADIEKEKFFPLLSKNCSRVADHTSRVKITLGGNICGRIRYKETILPLLLTDCNLVIASKNGLKELPIHQVFNRQINLESDEFIISIIIDKSYLEMPYTSKKQTRSDRISYPLLTLSAIKVKDHVRIALSGLCEFPFRALHMEEEINQGSIKKSLDHLPYPILSDLHGTAEYRRFVLEHTLRETLKELGKG